MNLTGIGLYAFHEAARLTKIPPRDLRRWLDGYSYRDKQHTSPIEVAPLWTTELDDEMEGIGFHDLLEVRFVRAFRQHGVSLQTIRLASERARELFDTQYPFTSHQFRTDGRSIFASATEDTGETQLLDLVRRQYAFRKIIEPSLYRSIEFDANQIAAQWYPLPRSKAIVLDPDVALGKPIVTDGAFKTSILYDAFMAEGDKDFVAKLYEVPVHAMEAAIALVSCSSHSAKGGTKT
jgi:DNA-binding transcriptional MerR regulator